MSVRSVAWAVAVAAAAVAVGLLVPSGHARADSGDGSVADGTVLTPFDVQNPAVGRLDPALLSAIQNAATAAATDGITMTITSGWRSPEFQQQLLDEAVQTYGSYEAARQYVQT